MTGFLRYLRHLLTNLSFTKQAQLAQTDLSPLRFEVLELWRSTSETRIESIESNLSALQDKLLSTCEKLLKTESSLSAVSGKMDLLEEKFLSHERSVTSAEFGKRIDHLAESWNELQAKLNETQKALQSKLNENELSLRAVEDRNQQLTPVVDLMTSVEFGKRIDNLVESQRELQTKLNEAQKALKTKVTKNELWLRAVDQRNREMMSIMDFLDEGNLHEILWVYRNRGERMDANLPFFDPARARFHLARYEFASRYLEGESFLDIASGLGYGSAKILQLKPEMSGTGVDLSQDAINYANKHYGTAALRFVAGSAFAIPLENESVDNVISFETLEHVQEDRKVIHEFSRVLKAGGRLVLSVPNAWALEDAKYHVHVYDYGQVAGLLEECFRIDCAFNQNSGGDHKYNHGQPEGIVAATDDNRETAECILFVCTKNE